MATKAKAANQIAEFWSEVDRRRMAIRDALNVPPAEPETGPEWRVPFNDDPAQHAITIRPMADSATLEKLGRQKALAAVDKDVFNAESLDGFTSKARAACSDQEGRLAIKTVRQRIGELANYAIHEVPSTDNQLWRHIWDQLNEAMHDLRPWAINKKKADTKTDTEKKSSMPTGDAAGFVNFLKNKLKAREPARGEMRSLAEEYCEENQGCGSDPESLERKARKYRHLWNPDT